MGDAIPFKFNISEKDEIMAQRLRIRNKDFGMHLVVPNSKRMASSFKNKFNILNRMASVYKAWGSDAAIPFAIKAVELWGDSEFKVAWYKGISYGDTGMNAATEGGFNNEISNLIWDLAVYSRGRIR